MIRATQNGRLCSAVLVCDRCQVESAGIIIWSISPLCYAEPTGWVAVRLHGNLWGHLCPTCATSNQTEPAPAPQNQEPPP